MLSMQSVVRTAGDELAVTYSGNIDATTFTASDFEADPGNESANAVFQATDNSIGLTFAIDISGATTLTYSGSAPGIQSPQTIALP